MEKYDIFRSYRQEGGYTTAKHLYDLLTRDGYRVSFDIDTLRNGDFDTSLLDRVDQSKDFILIIDEHAFDRTLNPDFDPKKDWMRQELAYALKKGKNVIPVFLKGTNGFPLGLPEDVRPVTTKNGPQYNQYYFNDFYNRLKKDFITATPKKKYFKALMAFVILVLLIFATIFIYNKFNPGPDNEEQSLDLDIPYVEYYEVGELFGGKHEIFAKVDGVEYRINVPEDQCYSIERQEDFDNDGINEALVRHIQACGGNALGDAFFFIKYLGDGFFTVSATFGDNVWEEPVIEEWEGQKSVVIIDTNSGFNNDEPEYTRKRYILKQGNIVCVENSSQQGITAIKEIKSTDFDGDDPDQVISLTYDLNGNGQEDVIECTFWDRWGLVMPSIIIDGNTYSTHTGYKRIGILNSRTNGYNDLVLDNNDIYKWNGSVYQCGENVIPYVPDTAD